MTEFRTTARTVLAGSDALDAAGTSAGALLSIGPEAVASAAFAAAGHVEVEAAVTTIMGVRIPRIEPFTADELKRIHADAIAAHRRGDDEPAPGSGSDGRRWPYRSGEGVRSRRSSSSGGRAAVGSEAPGDDASVGLWQERGTAASMEVK
jgi:hypothetical protein